MPEKIKSMFVFEMMGRPAEHVSATMNQYIDTISEIENLKIISRTVHEPKLIEKDNPNKMFSTFAEVEVETEDLNMVFTIVLQMLPAHIEIINPEEIILKNFELSGVLSDLAIRLHKYDEVAKAALGERNILNNRIKELQEKINELEKKKTVKKTAKKDKK